MAWGHIRGIVLLLCVSTLSFFNCAQATENSTAHISANSAAVDEVVGNGWLQKQIDDALTIKDDHGIKFGGMWIGDTNVLLAGGIQDPQKWTSNSLLVLDVNADAQKLMNLHGGKFGAQFLQFNGQDTNSQAGSIQGYNSLPGSPPLNRSELYQLWYRQELWNKTVRIRVGKVIPSFDFGNVSKPISLTDENLSIPSVSGLIFTPLFINPTTMGVIPGYYNSAYGVTVNIAPVKSWYLSLGGYDGSQAQGVQTGINAGPSLDGSYFYIAETGTDWLLGKDEYPGDIAVGSWHQTGEITNTSPELSEDGASGVYFFGSQRLWYRSPRVDASGVSMYYQYGISDSDVLPITRYVGAGLTAFGLVPHRNADSFGAGVAYSWLNANAFDRPTELMYQAYYQAQVMNGLFFEPVISFIPTPGASETIPATWTGTLRMIALF